MATAANSPISRRSTRPSCPPWDYRQDQPRGALLIVVHGLVGSLHLDVGTQHLAGVQVAVEAREVAARYLQPDAVPCPKYVAGHPQVNRQLIDLAGGHEL